MNTDHLHNSTLFFIIQPQHVFCDVETTFLKRWELWNLLTEISFGSLPDTSVIYTFLNTVFLQQTYTLHIRSRIVITSCISQVWSTSTTQRNDSGRIGARLGHQETPASRSPRRKRRSSCHSNSMGMMKPGSWSINWRISWDRDVTRCPKRDHSLTPRLWPQVQGEANPKYKQKVICQNISHNPAKTSK